MANEDKIPLWLWICASVIALLCFTGIILCVVAFVSACEELVITIKSKNTP